MVFELAVTRGAIPHTKIFHNAALIRASVATWSGSTG
jgi:hypothetical protein